MKIRYELSNHLGNVLVTLSDKRIGTDINADGKADYYTAEVSSANDYYAGGSYMGGRQYNSTNYKFGYNKGSLKDDEIYGSGNALTTFFREVDTRLMRWWSTDPKFQPWQSPYNIMDNNPILFNDPLGDIVKYEKKSDKVNSTIARIFSKSYREDFRIWKKSDETYTLTQKNDRPSLISGGIQYDCPDDPCSHEIEYDKIGFGGGFGSGGGFGGGTPPFRTPKIPSFDCIPDTKKFEQDNDNNDDRVNKYSLKVDQLSRIRFTTFEFPDMITITNRGNYIAGTEDQNGNNTNVVTSSSQFYSVMDTRADGKGYVIIVPTNNLIKGRINITVTTNSPFRTTKGNLITNKSKWVLEIDYCKLKRH